MFVFVFLIPGGIVGFSQNATALEKWRLTAHLWVAVSANFKAMLKLGGTHAGPFLETTKSGKSEKIVEELLHAFSRVANPFTFDKTPDVNNKHPLMMLITNIH